MQQSNGDARVVVLGANSQIGCELALLLSLAQGVTPVAVARSSYSLAMLSRAGIDCVVANAIGYLHSFHDPSDNRVATI